MSKKFSIFVLVLAASLILAACPAAVPAPTGGAADSGGETAASDAGAERGHLNVSDDYSFGTATTLDPHDPNRFYVYTVMSFETLVAKDASGGHNPALAAAWEPNDDATEWTISLREGVMFHDGTEMTGDDVAYSIMRLTDPEVNSPLLASFEIVQDVEVTGDYEVVVSLDPANVDFPEILTAYQAAIMRDGGAETIAEDGIGTGPFKLSNLDIPGVTDLVAHDEYWGGPPASGSASIIAISDGEARVSAMLAGQIDWLGVTSDQVSLFEGDDDLVMHAYPTGAWDAMVMRTDTAPFDDPLVRKAIRMVADREEIVAQALGGNGVVTCDHPVWSGDIYRADIDCSQDIEGAKALLEEAGYPDGIDIEIHTSPLVSEWTAMLETYQAQAAEAGIRLTITQAPSDGFWSDTWMKVPFSTTSWGERSAAQILPEAYRSGMSWNETYYSNADFDELIDAAAAEIDLETRIGYYQDAQNVLWEDGGSFVPYHKNGNRVLKSCISGIDPMIGEFHIDYSLIASDC